MKADDDGMRRFTSRDLQRPLGEAQEAALREAVLITFHGRDRLVVMAADAYAELTARTAQENEDAPGNDRR